MKKTSAIAALGALAQETRLDIFRLLVEAGPGGIAAGEIGAALKLPLPTLSFHLAQLRHAGLTLDRRQGRSIIYAANYPAMRGLVGYLTENCCGADAASACALQPTRSRSTPGVPRHEAPARARRR